MREKMTSPIGSATGYGRPVPNQKKLHPVALYHVTVNKR